MFFDFNIYRFIIINEALKMVKLTETGQSAGKNKDFKTLLGVVSERKDIVVLQGLYKKLLKAKWATKFNETIENL